MTSIQVRLDGPNEEIVRQAAKEMGVQVNRVKVRTDTVQLYGSKVVVEKDGPEEDLSFVSSIWKA